MDFGKMISNASSAVTRAFQYTEEKLFNVEKTQYDEHTLYLMDQTDLCQNLTEKIVKSVENYIEPNPAYRLESMVYEKIIDSKPVQHDSPASNVANAMLYASHEISTAAASNNNNQRQNSYSKALKLSGDTHRVIGNVHQQFICNTHTKFIEPLYSYLEQVKNVQKERRELELKRLDLDSAKARLKRVVSEEAKKATEKDLKLHQMEFEQQLEVTNLLMENVIASLDYHTRLLCNFVDCEVDYYEQCSDEISKLRDALKE